MDLLKMKYKAHKLQTRNSIAFMLNFERPHRNLDSDLSKVSFMRTRTIRETTLVLHELTLKLITDKLHEKTDVKLVTCSQLTQHDI